MHRIWGETGVHCIAQIMCKNVIGISNIFQQGDQILFSVCLFMVVYQDSSTLKVKDFISVDFETEVLCDY